MDFGVLAEFNPWWQRGAVPESLLGRRKRVFFDALRESIGRRFITLVYGLRRVGKTTSFYQIIQHLLENGVEPTNILYYSFDEKTAGINEVVSAFEEKALKKRLIDSEKIFIFFDEIQKVVDWESRIKVLYDLHPKTKIFLSGSATVSLKKKSLESLAGRIMEVQAKPLLFREFLEWKDVKTGGLEPELAGREMQSLLSDYLRKGGFPEIVSEEKDEIIKSYVKNAVLEKILYRDIPEEFGAKDIELLKTLLELFVKEPGMIISPERLSKDLGRSKVTVTNYIEYLKYSILIAEVRNIRPNMLLSSRKAKKIYPTNTSFCFAVQPDFYADKKMEKVFEVAVATHAQAENYYRNSFEVDFVAKDADGALLPIEVKHGNAPERQLRKFMGKFGAKKGILVTKDITGEKEGITAMPLWQFLMQNMGK